MSTSFTQIKKAEEEEKMSIAELREKSRREYLKMREEVKMQELVEDIQDEEYLFAGKCERDAASRNSTDDPVRFLLL